MITATIEDCKYCHSNDIITNYTEGTIVCKNCGTVLEDRIIDEQNETRANSDEAGNKLGRVGGPINYDHVDTLGNDIMIVQRKNGSLKTKRKYGDTPVSRITKLIDDMANKLSIKECITNQAKDRLVELTRNNKLKGKSKKELIGTVFLLIFKKDGMNYSPLRAELERMGITKQKIAKCIKFIKENINMTRDENSTINEINDKLKLYYKVLGMKDNNFLQEAIDLACHITKQEILTGKQSKTVAISIIYLLGKIKNYPNWTIANLKDKCKFAENTLNNAYNILLSSNQLPENIIKGLKEIGEIS